MRSTRQLIEESGFAALSMDAIAVRAGVSKATLYRWWSNRSDAAMDALLEVAGPPSSRIHDGSALDNLRTHLHIAADFATSRAGRAFAGVIGDAQHNPELAQAVLDRYLAARRATVVDLVMAAIDEGDLSRECDPEVVIDVLVGPIYYRLLLTHSPITGGFVDKVFDLFLQGMSSGRGGHDHAGCPASGPHEI